MRLKKPKVILTDRDYKILNHLFRYKFATSTAIAKVFYQDSSLRSAQFRLKKLFDAGIVNRGLSEEIGKEYFYYPNKRTFNILYPRGHLMRGFKYKSPCPKHDLVLTDVLKKFENSQVIFDIFTENELLVSSNQWKIDNIFSKKRPIRPDALFTTKSAGTSIFNAIEVELNQKGVLRYTDKVQSYYQHEDIKHIFFLSYKSSIIKKVKEVEKSLYPSGYTKFLYADLSYFLENEYPLYFEDCRDHKIKFI